MTATDATSPAGTTPPAGTTSPTGGTSTADATPDRPVPLAVAPSAARRRPRHHRVGSRLAAALAATVVVALAVHGLRTSPTANDLTARRQPASWSHPLGTDHLGRDTAARVVHGAGRSIGLAGAAVAGAAATGLVVGSVAGWRRGRAATVVLTATDAVAAVPTVVVALAAAAVGGPGTTTLVASLVLAGWAPHARLAHQLTTKVATAGFVEAAIATGATSRRIVRRHVWPNAAGPLLAHAVLALPAALLTVAGLSYLGLGPQPPTPEWGSMLAEAQPHLERAPLAVLAPGAAVVATGLAATAAGRALERRVATGHLDTAAGTARRRPTRFPRRPIR